MCLIKDGLSLNVSITAETSSAVARITSAIPQLRRQIAALGLRCDECLVKTGEIVPAARSTIDKYKSDLRVTI